MNSRYSSTFWGCPHERPTATMCVFDTGCAKAMGSEAACVAAARELKSRGYHATTKQSRSSFGFAGGGERTEATADYEMACPAFQANTTFSACSTRPNFLVP